MDDVRWGIIGCGDVTEVKSGPAFQKVAHSTLSAVMRRDRNRARDYAERHGVPKWYDDAGSLLADRDVDAVYVATPPDSHEEYVIRAAAAGKPALVEKPMARTHAECLRMIAACGKAGVPLFVAYYRRSLPPFLRVKQLIDDGAIGEVQCVSIRLVQPPYPGDRSQAGGPWRVQPQISGGGYFVDLASHQLDFLDYLFGPVLSVHGEAGNRAGLYPAEDTVTAAFTFATGVYASGAWCFTAADAAHHDEILIMGRQGQISFSTFGKTPVQMETAAGRQEFSDPYPSHIHQPFVASVVEALRGRGECPSSGVSAARATWVMDRILHRYRVEHPEFGLNI